MKPEIKSFRLLGVTRSKAKMYEYDVPEEHHIEIKQNPNALFTITIGLLGDLSATVNRIDNYIESYNELKEHLIFSAYFFDSYLQSKLNENIDAYLFLLSSASYYLCDLPGSSSVLISEADEKYPNIQGLRLEDLMYRILRSQKNDIKEIDGPFKDYINPVLQYYNEFYYNGNNEEELLKSIKNLREYIYEYGTPRQLLLADVNMAIIKRKIFNSSWNAIPLYTGLGRDKWIDVISKKSFIKEFWPAQHLLGKAGILKGESAIVQMPTSAGKTKAVELIIRSAFLSYRTSLVVIIAPFRALCHEIKNSMLSAFSEENIYINELSDTLQTDYSFDDSDIQQQIIVVTPEKLLYVLRHEEEIASSVGLLIFDEGHQFDNGTRGITYELLLTSLKSMISEETQKVLISAVISNAEAVGEWLNNEPKTVTGTTLTPTLRSIGFVSWLDQRGRIEYVSNDNIDTGNYFVPRVIESFQLNKKPRERKIRFFPTKSESQSIALYLGLKLVSKGSIAIFCGRKTSAASICNKVVDLIERDAPITFPAEYCDIDEIKRLHALYQKNLGVDADATKCSSKGIFSHHANIPHGIRLAVEYAMREDYIRFVICTSTLAQGVNLPIRYLIVSNVYQGKERIKVRDFHNLIGRAGRSGMHTEGSVLFSDPDIYDTRNNRYEKWKWQQVKDLLETNNSEPCVSNLLSIFEPIESDDKKYYIPTKALDFANAYIEDSQKILNLSAEISQREKGFSYKNVERQVLFKIDLITSIESFLLSHWDEKNEPLSESDIMNLAKETLAYYLADDDKGIDILELFKLLSNNISDKITEPLKRKIYGRTLYGINSVQIIENWVKENISNLTNSSDASTLFSVLWPIFNQFIKNKVFAKIDNPDILQDISYKWISGDSFQEILGLVHDNDVKLIWGKKRRHINIDHIVDLCENGLSYDGSLLINAVVEVLELIHDDIEIDELKNELTLLQKKIKYGLPNESSIIIHELGFTDRVISQEISESIKEAGSKIEVKDFIKKNQDLLKSILENYPLYYQSILEQHLK